MEILWVVLEMNRVELQVVTVLVAQPITQLAAVLETVITVVALMIVGGISAVPVEIIFIVIMDAILHQQIPPHVPILQHLVVRVVVLVAALQMRYLITPTILLAIPPIVHHIQIHPAVPIQVVVVAVVLTHLATEHHRVDILPAHPHKD